MLMNEKECFTLLLLTLVLYVISATVVSKNTSVTTWNEKLIRCNFDPVKQLSMISPSLSRYYWLSWLSKSREQE
jgi:hypothetical protein